jgi:hypothetical protein
MISIIGKEWIQVVLHTTITFTYSLSNTYNYYTTVKLSNNLLTDISVNCHNRLNKLKLLAH